MADPFLLIQLSDSHIGAEWGDEDPAACLAAAVRAVGKLDVPPGAVVLTGDLTDNATAEEYADVKALLAPLGMHVHVIPGNHDQRAAMREAFDLLGDPDDPIQYSADLGPMRMIALDTVKPGSDAGELGEERLAWLDAELAQNPDAPTVIAMHHPPFVTGLPPADGIGLRGADRKALGGILERHRQVVRLIAGHVHRTIVTELSGRPVISVPSTYRQGALEFKADDFETVSEPPGFGVHLLMEDGFASHIHPVT